MKGKVWVIIPVYNAQHYVKEAVSSVLRIGSRDISILLIDDGSTDQSGLICDQLANENDAITVIHQENGGVSHARNVGIEYILCREEVGYIAFLDADDTWAKGICPKDFDQRADLLAFSMMLSNESGDRYRMANQFANEERELCGANTEWLNDGYFTAFLYSIELIRTYRLRFLRGVKLSEDNIFWRQATFCARSIIFSEKVLYIYRMNHASATHTARKDAETTLHIPKAWDRAKTWIYSLEQYTDEEKLKWESICENSSGATLLEAARVLAEQGYRPKCLKRIISETPLYAYIQQLKIEKLAYWQQKDLRLWRKSVFAFVWKHRMRGIALSLAKRMMSFNIVRRLREQKRFRITNI